jgi:hypothetical protein
MKARCRPTIPLHTDHVIFGHKASPTGKILVASQYAERAYRENIKPFMVELKERRIPLVNETLAYSFPDVIE